ncbi:MAG: GNAT family N-acetyltransferase [Akkermansia sp.]|nr:GNAT family N-acetyltransferase [Akkermansia sp.]
MRVTRIDAATHPLAGEWWRLYEAAFPASERRSADWHAVALADPAFHVQHLADAAGFAGILSYWKWAGLTYVEHLAIVPERRGQGLGRRALSLLSRPLILEIEPVVDAATARRLAFYESCGLVRLPQPHVQLAYQTGQPDVPLWLLSQPALDAAEVARFEELFMAGPMRYRARA